MTITSATPYEPARLSALRPGPPWAAVRYIPETGSTNADLLADPAGPSGEVLVTDHQSAGRGRLGRRWTAPPGSSLMFSARLRPTLPPARRGWLPIIAGLSLCGAVQAASAASAQAQAHAQAQAVDGAGAVAAPGPEIGLKWPNDLLIDGGKSAGILVQAEGDATVIGVGCNVALDRPDLPVPTATSLALAGIAVDRVDLLEQVLRRMGRWYLALEAAGGDAEAAGVAAAYRTACLTVGLEVRVDLADGPFTGVAVDIAPDAALVVKTAAGDRTVHAGDAVHLRPAP